jgi:flagella basal body P-ring formation protein FlgA
MKTVLRFNIPIFILLATFMTAQDSFGVAISVVRVLDSVQVPSGSTVYLKDIAQFENFPELYRAQVEYIKIAETGAEFSKMSSVELLGELRPSLKKIEKKCRCKISLNLPRSLQNHTMVGDFSLEKAEAQIMEALKSQCDDCEFTMEPLRVAQGAPPAKYTSWEMDRSAKNLRGSSVVGVYFDQKSLQPLLLKTQVSVRRPVLRMTKSLTQGTPLNESQVVAGLADVTYERKKLARLKDISNSELARTVTAGQIIFVDDLAAERVIRTGQPLSIEMSHGSFHIKMAGVAKRSGRVGEKIPVRVNNTKKEIVAEVVGDGRVRMQR